MPKSPQSTTPHHLSHTLNPQKTVQIHTALSILQRHPTHLSHHHPLRSLQTLQICYLHRPGFNRHQDTWKPTRGLLPSQWKGARECGFPLKQVFVIVRVPRHLIQTLNEHINNKTLFIVILGIGNSEKVRLWNILTAIICLPDWPAGRAPGWSTAGLQWIHTHTLQVMYQPVTATRLNFFRETRKHKSCIISSQRQLQ